jgi:hypothetical protein
MVQEAPRNRIVEGSMNRTEAEAEAEAEAERE